MSEKIYTTIALVLKRRLRADPSYVLPSAHALAREYGVAKNTMWKALRNLSRAGLVTIAQGMNIRRADHPRDPGNPRGRATRALFFEAIKTNIRNGAYQPGELLPKYDSFVSEFHVARDTIVHAIDMLAKEGLIHKKGRRWIVGPRPIVETTLLPGAPSASGPVVLVLCTDIQQNVFHNFLIQSMWSNLQHELLKKDIQMQVGYRIPEGVIMPIRRQGLDEVTDSIRQWGGFYRGALVYDQHCDADTLASWATHLSDGGAKPVIYFDQSDMKKSFTRSELSLGDFYYRMHFDESGAVTLALKQLVDIGHRTIGLPAMPWEKTEWVGQRTGLIGRLARDLTPCPTLVTAPLDEPFWDPTNPQSSARTDIAAAVTNHVLSRRKKTGRGKLQSAVTTGEVRACTPSMATLLDRGVTAIIALNDWLAHQIYGWCHLAGVSIPANMSLISFDNDPISITFPVSTVDFGYGRLGYLAARLFCGARLSEADRDGNVPSVCTIVNHGSVARPGPA